jgi:hypothetical protein
MTIAISVRVGEGLVYAADSTSSLFTEINGVSVLSQSFHHAQKLVQVRNFPIGILTFGLGLLGSRNIESLVAEFESEVLPKPLESSVRVVVERLRDFLSERYDEAVPPPDLSAESPGVDTRPRLGVVVGGYTAHRFQPEEYSLQLPGGHIVESPTAAGLQWWGQTEALQRLLLGHDSGTGDWLREKGVPEDAIPDLRRELTERFGWRIQFDGMPLQDAIDFAVFLTNVAIGHSRFVTGPPVCGGHVDVATISHRGFEWIRRKTYHVKSDSAFF